MISYRSWWKMEAFNRCSAMRDARPALLFLSDDELAILDAGYERSLAAWEYQETGTVGSAPAWRQVLSWYIAPLVTRWYGQFPVSEVEADEDAL